MCVYRESAATKHLGDLLLGLSGLHGNRDEGFGDGLVRAQAHDVWRDINAELVPELFDVLILPTALRTSCLRTAGGIDLDLLI